MFAEHSWYFRNALVRANYNDLEKGVRSTNEYLNRFFGNLLLGEKNVLKNREMLVVPDSTENKAQNKAQIKRKDSGLRPIESAVMEYLKGRPDATQIETADAVDRSRRSVQEAITSLKEKGVIKREGSKKTGKWIVK